jgi:hypothetical protein
MTAGPAVEIADANGLGVDQALFVYGVLRGGTEVRPGGLDSLTGVDGAPVQLVERGGLAAAVTPMVLDRPPGRRAELLAYQAVLDVLAEGGPVAPVRFGSVLADADAVAEDLLLAYRTEFEEILERLDGRRQFNLRASYVEEAVLADLVATDPEIRALRARTRELPEEASYGDRVRLGELVARALEHRSTDDAAMLLDAVAPLAAEHVVRRPPSAEQVLDVALLVDDSRSEELVGRLEDLAEAVHESIRMSLLGPLAAYDFVGDA